MEQKSDQMTFLRTLGTTLCLSFLFFFIFADVSFWTLFVAYIVIGFLLCYLLKTDAAEEFIQKISITYLAASITTILLNFSESILNMRVERIIPLDLFSIAIGLYGTAYIWKLKDKEEISYRQAVWSIVCVVIVYLLTLLLEYFHSTSWRLT